MESLEPRSELMSSLKEYLCSFITNHLLSNHVDAFRLLISGDFSDLTILCEPYKHKVHKAIICPRSEFFNAACRFGKVGDPEILP